MVLIVYYLCFLHVPAPTALFTYLLTLSRHAVLPILVTSCLSVRTYVIHIRLAVHLGTALVLLSGSVWTALDLRALHASPLARPARLRPIAAIALLLLLGSRCRPLFENAEDVASLHREIGRAHV